MWHTHLGDRVLEGREAIFYLSAARETVALLQDTPLEEMDWWLPATFDAVFDAATAQQKIVLLHQCLLALLDPNIPQPELTNVIEAAAYLPFQVMKSRVEEEISFASEGVWGEEDLHSYTTRKYYYRRFILQTCQSLNWKVNADIERPKIRNERSNNLELWHAAVQALAERIFWDDDWQVTTRYPGIVEGKHPQVVQVGGLSDYLTNNLPQVNDAQVILAVRAITCWQLPTAF